MRDITIRKIGKDCFLAKFANDTRPLPINWHYPDTIANDDMIWTMPDGTNTTFKFFGAGNTMQQATDDLFRM